MRIRNKETVEFFYYKVCIDKVWNLTVLLYAHSEQEFTSQSDYDFLREFNWLKKIIRSKDQNYSKRLLELRRGFLGYLCKHATYSP